MSQKKIVSMTLPQSKLPVNTRTEKDVAYELFKNRCEVKSNHAYRDLGEKPVLLRLHLKGSEFDSIIEVLVRFGSFQVDYSSSSDEKTEIGFSVIVRTIVDVDFKLVVLKKQFKAYLITNED